MAEAEKIQSKASKVGFDWNDPLVVLDKLPFPRPNEPLLEARREDVGRWASAASDNKQSRAVGGAAGRAAPGHEKGPRGCPLRPGWVGGEEEERVPLNSFVSCGLLNQRLSRAAPVI